MLFIVLGIFSVILLLIFAFDELFCTNETEDVDSFVKMIALADGNKHTNAQYLLTSYHC